MRNRLEIFWNLHLAALDENLGLWIGHNDAGRLYPHFARGGGRLRLGVRGNLDRRLLG